MAYYSGIYKSPVGPLHIVADDKAIRAILFGSKGINKYKVEGDGLIPKETPLLKKTYKQLDEYFAGKRKDFDLPLNPQGTEFQMKAWRGLQSIPFGKTISYQELAKKIKNPKAIRAVGGANNKNPICIVIPCHRVIGKDGRLVGFGGGLPTKEHLLKLEGCL